MSYYLVVDMPGDEDRGPEGEAMVYFLSLYEDDVWPVFTSPDSLWDFVETYYHEEVAPKRFTSLERNSFELADLVATLEEKGLGYLVFDPTSASAGQ